MAEYKGSILETVGETPLVRINRFNPYPRVNIYAKLEGLNPLGSVKERIAVSMVEGAEKEGVLTKDKIILEASSGNTGIGLAMLGAVKGYKVTITMSRGVSKERRKLLKAMGAKIILTPAEKGTDGAIDKADEIYAAQPDKYCRLNQYTSKYNPLIHYQTTGPEIWRQTGGKIDIFVVGLGTTGTIMGAGQYLRERNPNLKIIAVEPQAGHHQEGLRNMTTARVPPIFVWSIFYENIVVSDTDAYASTRQLALVEGIFAGISSGTAIWAALQVAAKVKDKEMVVIFPDRGEKYLSLGKLFGPR
ncbi:MAG: cysteine synthase family protein [Thermodesulfobacteriota bacterium]